METLHVVSIISWRSRHKYNKLRMLHRVKDIEIPTEDEIKHVVPMVGKSAVKLILEAVKEDEVEKTRCVRERT